MYRCHRSGLHENQMSINKRTITPSSPVRLIITFDFYFFLSFSSFCEYNSLFANFPFFPPQKHTIPMTKSNELKYILTRMSLRLYTHTQNTRISDIMKERIRKQFHHISSSYYLNTENSVHLIPIR